MKKILSIFTILFTFSFTSHSYSKTEIHWWYGNSGFLGDVIICLLYTSPSPRDGLLSRMPSSA